MPSKTSPQPPRRGDHLGQLARQQLLEIAQQAPGVGPAAPGMFANLGSLSVQCLPDQAAAVISAFSVQQYKGLRERLKSLAQALRSPDPLDPRPDTLEEQAAAFLYGLQKRQEQSGAAFTSFNAGLQLGENKFTVSDTAFRPGMRVAAATAMEELIRACDSAMLRSSLRSQVFAAIPEISDAVPALRQESVMALQMLAGIEPRTDFRPFTVPKEMSTGVIDSDTERVAAWYATGGGTLPDLSTKFRVYERVFTLFVIEHNLRKNKNGSQHYADLLAKIALFKEDIDALPDALDETELTKVAKETGEIFAAEEIHLESEIRKILESDDPRITDRLDSFEELASEFSDDLNQLSSKLKKLNKSITVTDLADMGKLLEKLRVQLQDLQDWFSDIIELTSDQRWNWKLAVDQEAERFRGLQEQQQRLLGSEVAYRTSAFLKVLQTDLEVELGMSGWDFGPDQGNPKWPTSDQVDSLIERRGSQLSGR